MKDKGISRDVGGRSKKRMAGEAPNLGQVGRMPSTESNGGIRRRRRRSPEDERSYDSATKPSPQQTRTTTLVWTVTLGVLGLLLIAVVFVFWLNPLMQRRDKVVMNSSPGIMPEAPGLSGLGEEQAIDLTKRALAARDPAEVKKLMHTDPASAAEVVAFLDSLAAKDGEIVAYDWVARLDTTRTDVEGVLVSFKKDDERRNRLALVSPDVLGNWKMDFAAFARLAVPDWSEFLDAKEGSAIVRVYVAEDQYFNGPFKESDGWRCFGVASPDVPELLFGYCQEGTPQFNAIRRTLTGGTKLMRMTLEIERVQDADRRQFLIKRVLAQDWAVGAVAFDKE